MRKGRDVCRDYYNNPAFLGFLGDMKGKTVLDVGCGEGYNTRLLAKLGARMTGVDISPKLIEFAREEERKNPLGIRYEVISFSNLSIFEDESLDVVVSFMALMDGPNYEGAVKDILRVLRPGGELIFSVTHPCFMTRGFGWIEDEQGSIKLTVSDYFNSEPWVENWGFSDIPDPEQATQFAVPVFPKTISEYLNVLIRTGFILRAIEEPRAPAEACKRYPTMQGWRDHAALFLYIRAMKPS
ncbi:MAG: class I SAM-dependent methyltransferase [Dehalococcoidia bacterium]